MEGAIEKEDEVCLSRKKRRRLSFIVVVVGKVKVKVLCALICFCELRVDLYPLCSILLQSTP